MIQNWGSGAKTRHGTIDFIISGFVKGAESNIDTKRNELITAIETAVETDITRNGNALDTMVVRVKLTRVHYFLLVALE